MGAQVNLLTGGGCGGGGGVLLSLFVFVDGKPAVMCAVCLAACFRQALSQPVRELLLPPRAAAAGAGGSCRGTTRRLC